MNPYPIPPTGLSTGRLRLVSHQTTARRHDRRPTHTGPRALS